MGRLCQASGGAVHFVMPMKRMIKRGYAAQNLRPRAFDLAVAMAVAVSWLLAGAAPARAQMSGVTLEVEPNDIGLMGRYRLGEWTPMRVALTNHGAEAREVVCRWLLEDFDGDEVVMRRQVALDAGLDRPQRLWMYAVPPMNRQSGELWNVQVLDADTGDLLDSQRVRPSEQRQLAGTENALAVMSSAGLGLRPYTDRVTRHESVNLLRGMKLANLPDRWYGLSTLDAIVWTSEGGRPTDAAVTLPIAESLKEWVRRGGHMVIVLPSVGQTWTASSELSELLPVDESQMRSGVQGPIPSWLYDVLPTEPFDIEMTVFDVDENDAATVLLENEANEPVAVAGRYGFGRVTVVGVDLTDRRLLRMGLPSGRFRVWNRVFGWQNPVFTDAYIEAERSASPPRISRVNMREPVELGRFVPALIAMRNTAAPALLAAIAVFGVYWLLAGPIAYLVLRQQGALRHSWLVFAVLVLVFSGVTWGGAWVIQPSAANVQHFSVVDIDANSGEVHTHSWLSLYLPRFGMAEVALAPGAAGDRDTLSSPGLSVGLEGAGFLDQQSYEPAVEAGAPNELNIPFRGTAKQLELDYRGPLTKGRPGVAQSWSMPQGEVRLEGFWPVGELSHGLPGTLRDVMVVYCPGQGQWPWIWRYDQWEPQTVLDVSASNRQRLVQRPAQFGEQRNWQTEGYLGALIGRTSGGTLSQVGQGKVNVASNVLIERMEMLTFYDMLPPPNFRKMPGLGQGTPRTFIRDHGRPLDLSHLTAGRRLIVIGYLEDGPLPAPLTVDGEPLPAEGWTMVRWVYDL